jgi:hypothetical protein
MSSRDSRPACELREKLKSRAKNIVIYDLENLTQSEYRTLVYLLIQDLKVLTSGILQARPSSSNSPARRNEKQLRQLHKETITILNWALDKIDDAEYVASYREMIKDYAEI